MYAEIWRQTQSQQQPTEQARVLQRPTCCLLGHSVIRVRNRRTPPQWKLLIQMPLSDDTEIKQTALSDVAHVRLIITPVLFVHTCGRQIWAAMASGCHECVFSVNIHVRIQMNLTLEADLMKVMKHFYVT